MADSTSRAAPRMARAANFDDARGPTSWVAPGREQIR